MKEEFKLNCQGFDYYCLVNKSDVEKCNPIVLLSGAFQNMNSWNKYLDYYSNICTVILVDLPGTGKADLLPHTYNVEFLAEVLYDMFQKLKIPKAGLVAVSYGTPIGILFTHKYPSLVSHLTLIGTMKEFPAPFKMRTEQTFISIRNQDMKTFVDEVVNIIMNHDAKENINRFAAIQRALAGIVRNTDDDAKLKYIENSKRLLNHKKTDYDFRFENPVLVFTGEYDSFTTPEHNKTIARLFKNSVFTTIKNSDHLCNLEQFIVTNRLIAGFLLGEDLNTIEGINKLETFTLKAGD